MAETAARRAWIEKNTTRVTIKLNHRTDADILSVLEGKPRQTEIKRLIRVALAENESKNSE